MKRIWEWLRLHPTTVRSDIPEQLILRFETIEDRKNFFEWLSSPGEISPYQIMLEDAEFLEWYERKRIEVEDMKVKLKKERLNDKTINKIRTTH